MTRPISFAREEMIDAGFLPVGLEPHSIIGPPIVVRAIECFCEHGNLDGFDNEEDKRDEGDHTDDTDEGDVELPGKGDDKLNLGK
jgi:hypothetical protein